MAAPNTDMKLKTLRDFILNYSPKSGADILKFIDDYEKKYTVTDLYGNIFRFYKNNYHNTTDWAVKWANGTTEWYKMGKLHRLNGPAKEWSNGRKEWYLNGKLHRTDGPAVELPNGDKVYYLNGDLHRTNGPALLYSGDRYWYLNNKLH